MNPQSFLSLLFADSYNFSACQDENLPRMQDLQGLTILDQPEKGPGAQPSILTLLPSSPVTESS